MIGEEQTATGAQLASGLEAFNLLVKNIQAKDGQIWQEEDAVLFLQPGQTRYQLGIGSPDHACLYSDLIQTTLSGSISGGAASIPVTSLTGIASGDTFGVTLDSGTIAFSTVNGTPSAGNVPITPALPGAATSGALVFDFARPLSRPLKVTGARRLTWSTAAMVPLIPMSRLDFGNLANQTTPGTVGNFFFDPQTGEGAYANLISVFNVNPAPLSAAWGVRFTAQRPIQDFSNLANLPDLPAEWQAALKWMLAMEIGPEYGVAPPIFEMIEKMVQLRGPMLMAWGQEVQGTTTFPFTQSVYQLIARSLRICNAIGNDEVPTYGLVMNAFIALQSMILGWQASDIHVWCEEECILFPQTGQYQYQVGSASADHATLWNSFIQSQIAVTAPAAATSVSVVSAAGIQAGDNFAVQLDSGVNFWTTVNGAPSGNVVTLSQALPSQASSPALVFDYAVPLIRPLRLYGGRRYNYLSGIDTPMLMFARLDYEAQPNKATPGTATQFFFDPQTAPTPYGSQQLGTAQLNLWPNPNSNQFGFRFTAQRPLQILVDLTSALDFPAEWQNAIAFNLAVDLWPEYGRESSLPQSGGKGQAAQRDPVTYQEAKLIAAEKLRVARGWDREPQSVKFGVSMSPGYRRS